MDNKTLSVKRFFESHHIPLSDIWLESCVNWCKEETLSPNYTKSDLQLKVFEQWLLLDLRDVAIASLPPNLSHEKKLILRENYSLQLISVVDISKPKLWQLQKIRKSNILTRATQQDSDIVGTAKRMLLLTLTDGVQEVEAMEYKPISSLTWNLAPGAKVQLKAPITVRRGRIMLEEHNIKVLGGQVDDLIIPFATENVLARFLKLPENPNPKFIEENLLTVKDINMNCENNLNNRRDDFGINRPLANNYVNQMQISNTRVTEEVNKNINVNNRGNAFNRNTSNSQLQSHVATANITEEEEERRIAEEIELLLQAETSLIKQPLKEVRKTPDIFDEMDFNCDDLENIDRVMANTEANNVNAITQNYVSVPVSFKQEYGPDLDEHVDPVDHQRQLSFALTPNITSIKKLLKNKENINKGIFRIKAKFKSIIEKLTVSEDEFKLKIEIADETCNLIVNVHSDVISNFAEFCPRAILSLKNSILDNDENAAAMVLKAIQRIKDKLLQLNNVMEIQISKNEEIPIIVNII